MKLIIGWLYPELMSTYGDRGNIICLKKRCEWRGIEVNVKRLDLGFREDNLKSCDLLFMGGAQDKQQEIVSRDFSTRRTKALKDFVENEYPGLYVCGAYQFLGKYYKEANGSIIKGLDILDLHTENPGEDSPRLIGNIAIQTNVIANEVKQSQFNGIASSHTAPRNENEEYLVGFENHGGRTYIGKKVKPLGRVIKGFGNNAEDKTEGAIYKNSFGSYFHGPILPKNPLLADHLIKLSLEKKYQKKIMLKPLDDILEFEAHDFVLKKLQI
jgi:lipid II isoglutaminyl synthase (glutamine-hydrolysing)